MSETTMTGPVRVGLPPQDPDPVDGCDVCGALARAPEAARLDGDLSKVSDINVEMRSHQAAGR
ncbi:hypothetical protein [Streptomyces blattellae]|uniref:hypothetical protein n=1 Tax=Streptomyces blattellae TaxID=2569855 RepID=UPI0012B9D123|nr:hypothetical protein [Streptomyces blattellae]